MFIPTKLNFWPSVNLVIPIHHRFPHSSFPIHSPPEHFVTPIVSFYLLHTRTTFFCLSCFLHFCHSRLSLIVLFCPLSEADTISVLPTKVPGCKTQHDISQTLNCYELVCLEKCDVFEMKMKFRTIPITLVSMSEKFVTVQRMRSGVWSSRNPDIEVPASSGSLK